MKTPWLFVISLVGLADSAAVLVLVIPSFFRAGEGGHVATAGVSATLAIAFAAGTLHWRPTPPGPDAS